MYVSNRVSRRNLNTNTLTGNWLKRSKGQELSVQVWLPFRLKRTSLPKLLSVYTHVRYVYVHLQFNVKSSLKSSKVQCKINLVPHSDGQYKINTGLNLQLLCFVDSFQLRNVRSGKLDFFFLISAHLSFKHSTSTFIIAVYLGHTHAH